MQTQIAIWPMSGDKPMSRLGGSGKDIPLLYLDSGSGYGGNAVIQFQPSDLKIADDYLTALVHAAQELQEQVRLQMQEDAISGKVPTP